MPEQHRELFEKLPYLVVATLDDARRPWASFLAGRPGFVTTPDARTLRIGAAALAGDPLMERLSLGAELAVLGIELHTRRRNRANGTVSELTPEGFALQVNQSFGNCPKHITPRAPRGLRSRDDTETERSAEGPLLSPRARALIAASDTFFIASSAARRRSIDPREGLDVSHRGGPVGFVTSAETNENSTLSFLDYSGNNLFNTLGNIMQNPLVGLTFVDFAQGDVLMLTGRASIDFSVSEQDESEGGERKVHMTIDQGFLLGAALPFVFSPV
jgi:predicted pyridoxine 5'-phosphate oxidase superfamily flavin-nucleotide-binding protein